LLEKKPTATIQRTAQTVQHARAIMALAALPAKMAIAQIALHVRMETIQAVRHVRAEIAPMTLQITARVMVVETRLCRLLLMADIHS
jgi:hypothetical protein